MKIAFVGKGGSGKTTVSSLVAQYLSLTTPVLALDADINMHMAELLGASPAAMPMISDKQSSMAIRDYLRGSNARIASPEHVKKSTPPGAGSGLITITNRRDWFMTHYTHHVHPGLALGVVGTYAEDGIASSCYHNNLAILENVLSHSTDHGSIVVDMVAGTDAFASTLFAQFDALFFVAEPTTRSLAVYRQYEALAESGGVANRLFVVGNKVEDETDEAFIREAVGDRLVATLSRSSHIVAIDKGRETLDAARLTANDRLALDAIVATARRHAVTSQDRLPLLWDLHRVYVGQGYVKDKWGDLTKQIDPTFHYPEVS